MRIRQRGRSLQLVRDAVGPDAKAEVIGTVTGPDYKLDDETASKLTADERETFDQQVGRIDRSRTTELSYAADRFVDNLKLVLEWLQNASEADKDAFATTVRAPMSKLRRALAKSSAEAE